MSLNRSASFFARSPSICERITTVGRAPPDAGVGSATGSAAGAGVVALGALLE